MSASNIHGVIAAVPTPLTQAGKIDFAAFVEHGQWCLNNGCDALNVLGTTGEANSLSSAQRSGLMEVAASKLDKSRLMVGTGAADLETAVALTRYAGELGYAGALILPPFYYKPIPDDGLFGWFEQIVARTTDVAIDIYLYNFPQLTGIEFSPELAGRLRQAFPDRVSGLKDSSGKLDYARRLAAIPGLQVFPSNEVSLSEAREANFAGCISATVNADPAMAAALWKNQSDIRLRDQVGQLRQAIAAYPLIAAVKHLVGKRTANNVWHTLALPNLPLAVEARSALDRLAARARAV